MSTVRTRLWWKKWILSGHAVRLRLTVIRWLLILFTYVWKAAPFTAFLISVNGWSWIKNNNKFPLMGFVDSAIKIPLLFTFNWSYIYRRIFIFSRSQFLTTVHLAVDPLIIMPPSCPPAACLNHFPLLWETTRRIRQVFYLNKTVCM